MNLAMYKSGLPHKGIYVRRNNHDFIRKIREQGNLSATIGSPPITPMHYLTHLPQLDYKSPMNASKLQDNRIRLNSTQIG